MDPNVAKRTKRGPYKIKEKSLDQKLTIQDTTGIYTVSVADLDIEQNQVGIIINYLYFASYLYFSDTCDRTSIFLGQTLQVCGVQ